MIPSIDNDLIARMDNNVTAYWGSYALAVTGLYQEFPGMLLAYSDIPIPLFRTVMVDQWDTATAAAAFDAAAKAKAPDQAILWRISAPLVEVAAAWLTDHGLTPSEPQPALLADLASMAASPRIEGLRIETVSVPEGLRDWALLTCDAFGLEDPVRAAMGDCEHSIPARIFDERVRYTGYLDGQPAAVSSVVMAGGLAGIYAVATLPSARNRGLGTAMTLHAMAEGRQRGANLATLQATDMALPVYQKIGFRTVHSYATYLQP